MQRFGMNICKVCNKKAKFKCDKCGKASYCSRECQFKDWNKHKVYCKIKKNNNNSNKNKSNRELKRVPNFPNFSNISNILKKESKRKKTEKPTNVEIENFVIKRDRKKRYCQTIAVKIKNISSDNDNSKKNIEEQNQNNADSNTIIKEESNTLNIVEKYREILFRKDFIKKTNNGSENSVDGISFDEKRQFNDEYRNEIIKKLYDFLIEYRQYLINNILLNSNRTYYSKKLSFFIETYYGIENYIISFILLIKYYMYKLDPLSLIKTDQALNILGKELFNTKNGLLAYSIDTIFQKFLEVATSKNVYQNLSSVQSIQNVSKRFLSLISCLIKYSKELDDNKMYMKSLSYYYFFYELSLKFIINNKTTEKILLMSNLEFNIGTIFVKNKYLNSAVKIYKDIIKIQKGLDPCSFICGAAYYNISIIYYVMDKIKESELYINEGFDKINKLIDMKRLNKQRDDFRRLTRLLLIFLAELNLDRNDYTKSTQCLKAAIEIMMDDNQSNKIRHKTQINKDERLSLKFLQHMKSVLGNYTKNTSLSPSRKVNINKDLSFSFNNRVNQVTALDQLFEIHFYSNQSDRVLFDEKIKTIINGLIDKITLFYNEELKKEREKNDEFSYLRSQFKKKNDKNNFDDKGRKRGYTLIKKDECVPELNVKDIVTKNGVTSPEKFRARNRGKTIARKKRNVVLKDEEDEKENDNILKLGHELKFITKETSNKILVYLNDKMIKKKKIIDNEKDISDFKYFFLLLTSLSFRQVEILNETQSSNMPMELYKNLPILFSKQFKNSLNPSQRNMFNKLRVLSLIRCKVLKDADKPITIDNLNYSIFHAQINFDDFKFNKISQIQEILREVIESGDNVKTKEENNNMHESRIYKKLKSFNISKRMEPSRNSFIEKKEENSNDKKLFKNYIQQKIFHKKLQFEHDSIEEGDEEEEKEKEKESEDKLISNDDVDFKYKNEFDIKKIRLQLIQKINKSNAYSEDEKQLYKDIINSGVFIELLNSFDSLEIKSLIKDLETIVEFLRFLINLRLKENEENEDSFTFDQIDKENKENHYLSITDSLSSSSFESLDVDIDENNIFNNDIRRTCNIQKPKFHLDINNFLLLKNPDLDTEKSTSDNKNKKKHKNKHLKSKTLNKKESTVRSTNNSIASINENIDELI